MEKKYFNSLTTTQGSILAAFVVLAFVGCARTQRGGAGLPQSFAPLGGVWDGSSRSMVNAGDTKIERQEWHLEQSGGVISGYYVVSMTVVSGDGRPYVCSREPQFSSLLRFELEGRVEGGRVMLQEIEQKVAEAPCMPTARELLRFAGEVRGNILTIAAGGDRRTLYRRVGDQIQEAALSIEPPAPTPAVTSLPAGPEDMSMPPMDVSGLWIWESSGSAPGGDQKLEREEWHVVQEGGRLTGYYDRLVRQISTDGHAYRCSMSMEFRIATRYRFTGEVRGSEIAIRESAFEVLEPSPCDNGRRRLDAYRGEAAGDEIRLAWGPGGQVLHRARPDLPTQRF